MNEQKRVEFRGRMVADHYPEHHAQAQLVTAYNDFADGAQRDRFRYGDPKDRYPGGITYASREERVAFRIEYQQRALDNFAAGQRTREQVEAWYPGLVERGVVRDPNVLVPADEVIRTDHRCPDCDVDVGEFHLPGCDVEVCPACTGQAIGCGCSDKDDEEDADEENAE